MKSMKLVSLATMFTCVVTVAFGQAVNSQVSARNGVVVDVVSDDFANRYEYSAPPVKFTAGSYAVDSFALVAKVKNQGKLSPLMIQGSIYYTGDWHFYNSALFKGGDPVDYHVGSRDVLSCESGCSYTEGFQIDLKPADISKHSENGVLAIQIRPTRSTDTVLVQIPVSYIDAVNEVAK